MYQRPVQSTVIKSNTCNIGNPATQATLQLVLPLQQSALRTVNNVTIQIIPGQEPTPASLQVMPASGSEFDLGSLHTLPCQLYRFQHHCNWILNGCTVQQQQQILFMRPNAPDRIWITNSVWYALHQPLTAPASGRLWRLYISMAKQPDGGHLDKLKRFYRSSLSTPIVNNATPNTFYRLRRHSAFAEMLRVLPAYWKSYPTGYTFTLECKCSIMDDAREQHSPTTEHLCNSVCTVYLHANTDKPGFQPFCR